MRVFILQPKLDDGPAFLASFLQSRGLGHVLCSVESGEVVPESAEPFDAIAMLGGTMSVNDDLPWLRRAEALLRDAVARDVPVLGHCLGGQLLAKVLGARVTANPQPEIGWCRLQLDRSPDGQAQAHAWFGAADGLAAIDAGDATADARGLPVYQWHHETFALPAGATLLAHSAACTHQAFAFGPHLGMQFHIEVDAEKLHRWCSEAPAPGSALAAVDSVQTEAPMRADTVRLLAHSQRVAGHIYGRWLDLAAQRWQRV